MRWTDREVGDAERATPRDIPALNRLFSDAFTERYRRDGLGGVRVPFLNPEVWGYAIENAGPGAFVWRDGRGEVAAFNMVHLSGREGWMGPLAVRVDRQEEGLGRRIVRHGVEWLRGEGAGTIGLETMPRTIDNIGFYSRLGFCPGRLTITLQGGATSGGAAAGSLLLGSLPPAEVEVMRERCAALTASVVPGADYDRECTLSRSLGLGEVGLVLEDGALVAWVLWHTASLAHGRSTDELRILKLVARDLAAAERAIDLAAAEAARHRLAHLTVRCQGAQPDLYGVLIGRGWRVQWTDLRMTLADFPEVDPDGVVLTNWEI